MTSPPDDDATLLARHVAGDPQAFGTLVGRHRNRMWSVALRTSGNREDAADAVQDALYSAYRGAAPFRGGSAVSTWLHRIVVNACFDIARRRAGRPVVASDVIPDVAAPDTPAESGHQAVMAMLAQLSAEQAAAVALVDIEGFPVAEAADILGVPAGTVKSRCARGRARLAAVLGNASAPPPVSTTGTTVEDA